MTEHVEIPRELPHDVILAAQILKDSAYGADALSEEELKSMAAGALEAAQVILGAVIEAKVADLKREAEAKGVVEVPRKVKTRQNGRTVYVAEGSPEHRAAEERGDVVERRR